MHGVFLAEGAVFTHLQSLGIVFLVFHRVVVSVFALGALKRDFGSVYGSHFLKTPCKKITPLSVRGISLPYTRGIVKRFLPL